MRYNVKKKHLRKLARLWLRDYEAATPAEREEMVEAAEEVYTGMDHYLELRNIAEQGGTPEGYAITRHRGERGAYVCRDMHTLTICMLPTGAPDSTCGAKTSTWTMSALTS